MILNITSNTFFIHDSFEVSSSSPLDFVLNINHSVLSFYSLNSTVVKVHDTNYIWDIIENGKVESHGIDTASGRPLTIITISGYRYQNWQKEEVNFDITLNHYGAGLGKSEIVNRIVRIIKTELSNLHPIDLKFLNEIARIDDN